MVDHPSFELGTSGLQGLSAPQARSPLIWSFRAKSNRILNSGAVKAQPVRESVYCGTSGAIRTPMIRSRISVTYPLVDRRKLNNRRSTNRSRNHKCDLHLGDLVKLIFAVEHDRDCRWLDAETLDGQIVAAKLLVVKRFLP